MDKKALILFTHRSDVKVSRRRISENLSQAENVLKAFLSNTFEALNKLGNCLDCDLIIATDRSSIESKYFEKFNSRLHHPIKFQLIEQQGCGFDQRIKSSLFCTFEKGYSKVVIIGNDCPDLTAAIIAKAFQCLENKDTVIGPAEDGGFYLLGLTQYHPDLFLNIHWCSDKVFSQIYENALSLSNKIGLVSTLSDIDSKKQLIEWSHRSSSPKNRLLLYIIFLILTAVNFLTSIYLPFIIKNHHRKRLWQKSPPIGP